MKVNKKIIIEIELSESVDISRKKFSSKIINWIISYFFEVNFPWKNIQFKYDDKIDFNIGHIGVKDNKNWKNEILEVIDRLEE